MVQMIEDGLAHPETPKKMVSGEWIGGKVVIHQCQMVARPVTVEHSITLDRSVEIENILLRIFKDHLHHCRLIRVVLLVRRLNIVLVDVLYI